MPVFALKRGPHLCRPERRDMRRALLIGLCGMSCHAFTLWAGDWPEYRGPLCNGHAAVDSLPLHWSESRNVRWKTPIHGRGWSTPVVLGRQIWLTTATEDGTEMSVLCLDRTDGRILLDRKLWDVPDPEPLGNFLNSYASPSPVVEPGRVYVHFGSYGTASLDTGNFELAWQRRDLPCNHFRGPASSPVIVEDLLILHMDGSDLHYVVALDKTTGATVWKTHRSTDYGDLGPDGQPIGEGDFRKAFNTPLEIALQGESLLISPSAKAVYAYHPGTGEEIWQVRHGGHSSACRTLFDGQLVYVNTGSGESELLAIDPRGRGDLTATNVRWRERRQIPKRSSPVIVDGRIYSVTDQGVATCLRSDTGELLWQQRVGSDYSASLLYACGRIHGFDQSGEAVVFEPGDSYRELARNYLDAGCMASPIAVDNRLIVRTKTHVYCLGND